MVSSRGNCEIVEVKDEQSTVRQSQNHRSAQVRSQTRDQRPPQVSKKGSNRSLEDDINKLFEAVNLRSAKSLDLSDTRRDPSKRPMRSNGSNSPVIGFSEPVSLKQALRGMCISQAAEMAAIKRASMPSSPRISEVGKITSMYRSVVVDSGGSFFEESSLSYRSKSATQSSCSSPSFRVKPAVISVEHPKSNEPCHNTLPQHLQEPKMTKSHGQNVRASPLGPPQKVDTKLQEKEKKQSLVMVSESPCNDKFSEMDKKPSGQEKVASSVPSKEIAASVRTVEKTNPKVRRKPRLQNVSASNSVKGSKEPNAKPTRSNVRIVKPSVKNKNLIIRRSKKVASSTSPSKKTSYGVDSDREHIPKQLICEKCQCSLRDTGNNNNNPCKNAPTTAFDDAAVTDDSQFEASNHNITASGREEKGESAVKTNNLPSKSSEKGGISQSSKSSFYDFSSSTTSLSDESNLSGSTCGNKPHMSKDARWEAINGVRKQYGFLGLSHFNLLKKLGSGDIGTVYLAELIGTSCPFAIKVMDNEFLEKRKKMPRAQTEREILKMLDHPFLPTLYAQFTSDNLSCLVMEFCPGGDLHVLRQKQPGRYFTEQAARFYVAEVLLSLEYLHMLGIVYRDLKPENILVREDGHIMLSDFDLSLRCSVSPMLIKPSSSSSSLVLEPPRISGPCAGSNCIDPFCTGPSCKVSCFTPRIYTSSRGRKHKDSNGSLQLRSLPQLVAEPTEARSNSFVGTHEYLAPEIIKGEGHGSAVDWWTLGVFLYELLYGKTPFKGSGNEETLANVVLQNLRFPDSPIVSFQARDLIRGLLVKEPEHRLGTETGAAEIKRHSFFEGLNWALIRCAVPPHVPEFFEVGSLQVASSREAPKKFMEYGNNGGEHVEFELF